MSLLNKLNSNAGYLVLIGGAEDKREEKHVLKRITQLRKTDVITVIPSASDYPAGLFDAYYYAFRDLGIEKVYNADIRTREEAEKEEYLNYIREADLIFFTGGDQVKLVNTLLDTPAFNLVIEKYNNGATIAGTSAGAAAASDPLLYSGDNQGLVKGSINFGKGFGLLKNITIDTHFENRGRLGRLSQFLCTGHSTRGMGIAENTAIIISNNYIGEVIGEGMVVVVDSENLNYTNFNSIQTGENIVLGGLQVSFLQPGTIFNLVSWQIETSEKPNYFSAETVVNPIELANSN